MLKISRRKDVLGKVEFAVRPHQRIHASYFRKTTKLAYPFYDQHVEIIA